MQASFGTKMQNDKSPDDTTVEHPTINEIDVIVEEMKKFKFTVMLPTCKSKQFLPSTELPLIVDVSKFFINSLSEFNKYYVALIDDEHPNLKKEIDRGIEWLWDQFLLKVTDDIGNLSPEFFEPEISSSSKPKKVARLSRKIVRSS
ncbi:hypothetical protein QAD02_021908 [Eretmocerus hayati]|uniref:Uncharacterized protein n=1 Tax=Eretmocerus hayati TaxID=131215 RepID=A0ACC2PS17_9HYME|nr:hypothetical protein QAD02_021908 [Eretmocerus hayati]